jgi:hypothetical protein
MMDHTQTTGIAKTTSEKTIPAEEATTYHTRAGPTDQYPVHNQSATTRLTEAAKMATRKPAARCGMGSRPGGWRRASNRFRLDPTTHQEPSAVRPAASRIVTHGGALAENASTTTIPSEAIPRTRNGSPMQKSNRLRRRDRIKALPFQFAT